MRKRTGSVRQTVVAEGPTGVPIYVHKSKWNGETNSAMVEWTTDVNKAKIWRYPGEGGAWLKARHVTVLLTGARLCDARTVPGWIEK